MTSLPRLFVKDKFVRHVDCVDVSISEKTVPLSTATMTILSDEILPARSYLELFTPNGSAGMYRTRSPKDIYGADTTTADLEHMIAEVGDYLVKAKYSEMVSATDAMKKVFSHYAGGKWKLGSVTALGTDKIALEAEYDPVLDVMLEILQQVPDCMLAYDFTTSPWTVKVVKKGSKVTAEGRLSRNLQSASVFYDDTELATRVWYKTFKDKKDRDGKWVSKDASTIKTYGVIERTVSTSNDMTTDQINHAVNSYLSEHKRPRVSIDIQASELSGITGESQDRFTCGALMRLALPESDTYIEDTITSVTWRSVYLNPLSVTVHLGDEEDTLVSYLHNLDRKGGGGGGGGKKKKYDEQFKSNFRTYITQNDHRIDLIAEETDDAGEILKQAGLKLNSKRVLIYAADSKNHLMSQIKTQSDRISLVVTGTGKNAKVNSASIILGFEKDKKDLKKSKISISADVIDMSGTVKATDFNALLGRFEKLLVGGQSVTLLRAGSIQTGTLRINGYMVNRMSKYIDGVGYINYFGYTG